MKRKLPIILPCMAALLLCVPLFARFFPLWAAKAPVFTDIIIETTAKTGINKQGELTLFRLLTVLGLLLCCLTGFLLSARQMKHMAETPETAQADKHPVYLRYLWIFVFPLLGSFIIFGQKNTVLLLGLCYFCVLAVCLHFKKEQALFYPCLVLPVLLYYALMAVLTVLVQISDRFILSDNQVIGTASALTLVSLLICCLPKTETDKKAERLSLLLCILQLPIPFLLVVYFVDHYLYHGERIRVAYAGFYYIFFTLLLLGLLAGEIRHMCHIAKEIRSMQYTNTARADRQGCLPVSRLISCATVMTIFIYHSFSAAPAFAQPDQHHHGEQMIPWQQIFGLHQSAYREYTPVSGLFPLVNGFIQNVLLHGTVSDYSPAISITVVLFAALTMWLLYRQIGGKSLLFAVFFALPSYNRQYMVLPVLLLLFDKALLEKPMHWLRCWIFSCFLAGLYYPLYGGALLLGTLPSGIRMLLRTIKETDWKTERKKPSFYILWFLTLVPVVLCLPLLLRMLRHTLTYSSQTLFADGISLFGQTPPDTFLPYLSGQWRDRLYLVYRFFLPMLPLWILGCLCLQVVMQLLSDKRAAKGMQKHGGFSPLFGLLAAFLTLAISYTYTLVRADTGVILQRTAPVLIAVFGIFLPVLLLRNRKMFPGRTTALLLGICFSLPFIIYHEINDMKFPNMWTYPDGQAALIMDDTSKLYNTYTVPDTFLAMDEVPILDHTMLGNSFMVADQVPYLTAYETVMQKCDSVQKQTWYMGFDGQGFYYYLNARACSTGFLPVGKSMEAQKEMLSQIKEKRPVVFVLDAQSNYYIYHWILTHDYVYCKDDDALYPRELFAKIYPGQAGDDYRAVTGELDLGRICASLGNSMKSLRKCFTAELALPSAGSTVSGGEYDYLYLPLSSSDLLAGDTQTAYLQISYKSDDTYVSNMICAVSAQDDLLLPLGMQPAWLLSENSDLLFTLLDEQKNSLQTLSFEELADSVRGGQFLKLRQIE